MMYAGVFGVVFALSKYHAEFIGEYDFTNSFRFAWAITYVGLLCVAAYGFGLPDLPTTLRARIATSVMACGSGALAMSTIQLVVGDSLLPRFVVFGAAALLVAWLVVLSTISRAGRTALEARDRVIVVGPVELASELEAELAGNPEKPGSVVGVLPVRDAAAADQRGKLLTEMVIERSATVLVLAADAQSDARIVAQVAQLHESGVRVRTMSLFCEEWLGKIPVADLGRVSLFFDIGEVHRERFGRLKRIIDFSAGAVGLVVLIVVTPIVVLGNLVANRGPLLYQQDRVGKGGSVFRILKFRTMAEDGSVPTDWTAHDDPRVTSFGRLLRATHLDELPQMWNIVRGDLSLVGPRPEQPRYVAELVDKLPFYDLRHIVRPGLTGWAQVKYGYAGDERDALEKLQYDFHYLRRQSVPFDLRIVARTARAVLGSEGGGR